MLACEGCVGSWCSLVSTLDCQSRGRGFKSRRARHSFRDVVRQGSGALSEKRSRLSDSRLFDSITFHRPVPTDTAGRSRVTVLCVGRVLTYSLVCCIAVRRSSSLTML